MKFDKNLHIVALFAAMFVLGAQAIPVTESQVRRVVSAWASANGSTFENPGSVNSVEAVSENGTNLYWIARMSNGGAVIAASDTNIDPIIAVIEKFDGSFPKGHPLPSILRRDMLNRLSVIGAKVSPSAASGGIGLLSGSSPAVEEILPKNLSQGVKSSIAEAKSKWAKYGNTIIAPLSATLAGGDSSPYVRRIVDGFEAGGRYTHWNQEKDEEGNNCYNLYTPENSVCGCVATAGAALLQFFGCVEDIGEKTAVVDSASGSTASKSDLTTMPGAIDWGVLSTNFGGKAETDVLDDAGRDLLGRIAYNLGVLVGMSWSEDASSAYLPYLDDALKAYGFSSARHVSFAEGAEGTKQYFKMIYAQNWAGAPVALGISGSDGHAVLACGYAKTPDEDEFCRVFMGWGGYGDSWYKFPYITDEFQIINEAVSMLAYAPPKDTIDPSDFDFSVYANKAGSVPVCGRANFSDGELKFPGVTYSIGEGDEAMTFTLTASVDSNGFFAVRIPADTKDLRIIHEESGTERTIVPFDSKVLTSDSENRVQIEAAMPAEVQFMVLQTVIKPTVESAREKALYDGKALLMVSGAGSMREKALIDYITYLDSTTDMSNRFVMVHINSSDYVFGDGDPSIGVFNPAEGDTELRWWSENGRLSYENFILHDSSEDGLVYTFDADDTAALTNAVDLVMSEGYDSYLRLHSGIKVVVKAVDATSGEALSFVNVVPELGVRENLWTNGEMVVFSAPAVYTNESRGVVYSCVGWTTNDVSNAKKFNDGNSAQFALSKGDQVEFSWLWTVTAYKMSASVNMSKAPEAAIALTPSVAWVYPGDRVTIVATNALYGGAYPLKNWSVFTAIANAEVTGDVFPCVNGTAYSITVLEPVNVLAEYEQGAVKPSDPVEFDVELSIDPPELLSLVNDVGSLKIGANTTYDALASFVAQSSDITDSTGGVWKCTGWVVNGVTNAPSGVVPLDEQGATGVELIWELQEPEADLPVPGEIQMGGLKSAPDGSWQITLTGAVKDCWYWLYSSDDLSKLAGSSDKWTASLVEKKQASEDGVVVFSVTSPGDSLFWRAKVTATETGEE